jgi:integrase
MSVYKSKKSPYYRYDFWVGGRRVHGSTRRTSRRKAEEVERAERERAEQHAVQAQDAAISLQLDHVADRYWIEIGQHHAGADNTERDLARVVDYFGKTKLITEITDDDVHKLVAWRRGHKVPNRDQLIANATVNRSTTEVVKKLFTYVKHAGVRFNREPNWRRHMLAEPVERVRELHGDEGERIDAAMRDDFRPLFAFAQATGWRQRECMTLRWSEVNWRTKQIVKLGKGRKRVTTPITPTVRSILWPLQGHHPEFVFTYVAARTRGGHVKGERYPLTLSGLKTRWRRTRKAAAVTDFRFHDFRHDFASKLLRATGNLKLVQKALSHASISTTARYAHVLDAEIAEALERIARDNRSRTKSRTKLRSVS